MLSRFCKTTRLHTGLNRFCVLFMQFCVQFSKQPQIRVISQKGVFLF